MTATADGKRNVRLPVLNLDSLATLPKAERLNLAAGPSGLVVHEAGHFLAAAALGIPADFIVFDWSPEGGTHAVHIRERYRPVLMADPAARLSMLVAGYAAELQVFGDALLNRAESDLRTAASVLGRDAFELERDAHGLVAVLRTHNPFRPHDAAAIVGLHNWLATAINAEGGPDGTFVVPNYRLPLRFRRGVPLHWRVWSYWTSQDAAYGLAVRDNLLGGRRFSGV